MKPPVKTETLIQTLAEAMREYDQLAFDEEYPHDLGPPATAEQIAKLEKILGKPLPPSYRDFLKLHNGWSDFHGGAKLLAVEDHGSKWVKQRIKEIGDLFFEDDSDNPFQQGMLPVLLGKDENSYLVLDPSVVRKNGEMDFVRFDYSQEEKRFKDFTSFLHNESKVMQELVEEERDGLSEDDEEED
jgi:SMI1 / KNR4 family (SUKH-1)